jgi:6-phosphogluconolactonase
MTTDRMPPARPEHPALLVRPADDVPAAAASCIADTLREAVAARGVAHWATTGGSSAPPIYRALAAEPLASAVPWDRVHTWWGDDRFVSHGDPLSNVAPIAALPMAAANLHPIPTEAAIASDLDAAWAAAIYAEELVAAVGAGPAGVPVLDLVILGVGPDGHILSVFPGSPAWDKQAHVVAVPAPTHIEPHVARVTLHPRLVAAARVVLVTTTGTSKAGHLARAWSGEADPRELPIAATLLPTATWILDEAAAAEIDPG